MREGDLGRKEEIKGEGGASACDQCEEEFRGSFPTRSQAIRGSRCVQAPRYNVETERVHNAFSAVMHSIVCQHMLQTKVLIKIHSV